MNINCVRFTDKFSLDFVRRHLAWMFNLNKKTKTTQYKTKCLKWIAFNEKGVK